MIRKFPITDCQCSCHPILDSLKVNLINPILVFLNYVNCSQCQMYHDKEFNTDRVIHIEQHEQN